VCIVSSGIDPGPGLGAVLIAGSLLAAASIVVGILIHRPYE
jgi:hypothetical protein